MATRPDKPRLHRTGAPTSAQLTSLADKIAHRVCRHLASNGWLEGEHESAFLSERAGGDNGLDALRISSITYRIATGTQAGRKAVTLQTLPGDAGSVGGFSLHAGIAAEAHESPKLERLCRYIARPAIADRRLSLSPQGTVRYQLKTPWRNGTTHVEFEPIEFIAKLAALVPPPRAQLTPSGRGKRLPSNATQVTPAEPADHRTPDERRRSMTWAQRIKRVFGIDVETCIHCGGKVKIVASVEEPNAIRAILEI